jgi:uncharacterized protein YgiM (DUF1202 family)
LVAAVFIWNAVIGIGEKHQRQAGNAALGPGQTGATSASQSPEYGIVNTDNLNLRSCSNPKCKVVAVMPRETRVTILERGQTNWWLVKITGGPNASTQGYVNSTALR